MASGQAFIDELTAFQAERLRPIVDAGRVSLDAEAGGDPAHLLQVAFSNELNVTVLAGEWLSTTPEWQVKAAFAKQAGDEANHAKLVAERLEALGISLPPDAAPASHPLFDYLRQLSSTPERIAAGLFTLEAMALEVNENFIALCERNRDKATAAMYRQFIQPDEAHHRELGRRLLAEHARDPASQTAVRTVVGRILETAAAGRNQAASRLGTACIPGC